jgi:maltose O-acetyltransferase
LAVVVDDAAQGITHVVRGEDLADNTARQILLQRALGLPTPAYLHTPLVRAADGRAIIMPGFFCDYGVNIHFGANAFVNANSVFLDCAEIRIGDNFQAGPGVQLLTPEHPLDAVERRGLESARPITIGDDVWIGGGAIVLAGVTISDRAVVGAGSVVTRDVPPDVVVVGNPAKVVKHLTRNAVQ